MIAEGIRKCSKGGRRQWPLARRLFDPFRLDPPSSADHGRGPRGALASPSQLCPYASSAGRLILGWQIVRDLDEALRRIDEHVFPYAMVRQRLNRGTFIGKVLVIRRGWVDGRIMLILVREPVGV